MCRLDLTAVTAQLNHVNSEKQKPASLYNLYKIESYKQFCVEYQQQVAM